MAVKPVKVLTDLLTKKQIIKEDINGNVLFRVTGSLGDGFISSSLPITASATYVKTAYISASSDFSNIQIITSSVDSFYNIDQAFHAIDAAVGNSNTTASYLDPLNQNVQLTGSLYVTNAVSASSLTGNLNGTASFAEVAALAYEASNLSLALKNTIEDTYKKLRYKVTGAFDATGYAYEILPNNASYTFPVSDIDYINISILVRESNASSWNNDLIAYEMKISGSLNNEIHILMFAQDIPTLGQYKLLAINENRDAFDLP